MRPVPESVFVIDAVVATLPQQLPPTIAIKMLSS